MGQNQRQGAWSVVIQVGDQSSSSDPIFLIFILISNFFFKLTRHAKLDLTLRNVEE